MQVQWRHLFFPTLPQWKKKNIPNCITTDTHIFVLIVKIFIIHDVVRIPDPLSNSSGLQKKGKNAIHILIVTFHKEQSVSQYVITNTFSSAAFLVCASIQVRSWRLLMNTSRMSLIISSIWCMHTYHTGRQQPEIFHWYATHSVPQKCHSMLCCQLCDSFTSYSVHTGFGLGFCWSNYHKPYLQINPNDRKYIFSIVVRQKFVAQKKHMCFHINIITFLFSSQGGKDSVHLIHRTTTRTTHSSLPQTSRDNTDDALKPF